MENGDFDGPTFYDPDGTVVDYAGRSVHIRGFEIHPPAANKEPDVEIVEAASANTSTRKTKRSEFFRLIVCVRVTYISRRARKACRSED